MNEHETTPGGPPSDEQDAGTAAQGPTLGPGLILEPPATQPVTASPTITYPTLPPAYVLTDDAADSAAPTPAPAAPAAPAAAPAPVVDPATGRRPVRVRTVVFGLVLLTISVISLLSLLADITVDGSAVGLAVLIGAGVALLAGGMAAASREAKGGPGGR
jgi:hypothetical protein